MRLGTIFLFITLTSFGVIAGVQQDVDLLIRQIEKSPCTFIRNGQAYTPHQAAEHMRTKWDYAQDKVNDIEVFIDKVASKSWFSGKPYMVECSDERITSEQWLTSLWQQAQRAPSSKAP